jgi:hypothetical protein
MTGFRTVAKWADSEADGRSWLSFFRKVPPSAATIAGQWFDYSTASGVPVPNYYASSPLVAATLEANNGIFIPQQNTQRWLKRMIQMSAAASVTGTTNQNQSFMLLDYLLYVPFIDLDAAGEEQVFDMSVTLPRYTDGEGVQMMLVTQAPTAGSGTYTVKYIDTNDVERTTETVYCPAAQPSGALCSSVRAAAGISPFIPLNAGVSGVKQPVSLTMNVANGGLAALVLVKPVNMAYVREESRRPTSSPTESYGDAMEVEQVRQRAGSRPIAANAFLGFIGYHVAGSVASAPLVGMIESFWEQ